jgi:hypothetical protein
VIVALAKDHPDTALRLNNLGRLHWAMGEDAGVAGGPNLRDRALASAAKKVRPPMLRAL